LSSPPRSEGDRSAADESLRIAEIWRPSPFFTFHDPRVVFQPLACEIGCPTTKHEGSSNGVSLERRAWTSNLLTLASIISDLYHSYLARRRFMIS
jgi:hypothetical protein